MEEEILKCECELQYDGKCSISSFSQCLCHETTQDTCKHAQKFKKLSIVETVEFISGSQVMGEDNSDSNDIIIPQDAMNKTETSMHSDQESHEIKQQNMIICYQKDGYEAVKDTCINEKCFTDECFLQNKVRQKVMFFSQLNEGCRSGQATLTSDDPKSSLLNSSLGVQQKGTNPTSLKNPVRSTEEINTIRMDSWHVPYCGQFRSQLSSFVKREAGEFANLPHLKSTNDNSVDNEVSCARSSSDLINSLYHYDDEKFGLSDSGVMSGPLSCSGHLEQSGSFSMVSDCSSASTGSFAFPILQSEWNNSPVRMAKADHRRYAGQRGWKLMLLCCRF